jgi:hypothetical protein
MPNTEQNELPPIYIKKTTEYSRKVTRTIIPDATGLSSKYNSFFIEVVINQKTNEPSTWLIYLEITPDFPHYSRIDNAYFHDEISEIDSLVQLYNGCADIEFVGNNLRLECSFHSVDNTIEKANLIHDTLIKLYTYCIETIRKAE